MNLLFSVYGESPSVLQFISYLAYVPASKGNTYIDFTSYNCTLILITFHYLYLLYDMEPEKMFSNIFYRII